MRWCTYLRVPENAGNFLNMFVFRKCFAGQHCHWLPLLILVLEIASVIFYCFSAAHCCSVCLCYFRFLPLYYVCRIFHWSSMSFHCLGARNCFCDILLLFRCTLLLCVFVLLWVPTSVLCLQNISLVVYVVSLSEILHRPSQQFTKRQKQLNACFIIC